MLFILPYKLYSFWRYLNFCLEFLDMYKNGLINKIWLISKFTRHSLGNKWLQYTYWLISQQEVKAIRPCFGQLIEYNTRNIFLGNHTQNVVDNSFPDSFLKNQNWVYLWINSLKFYTVCSYCMPSWWVSKYIETKMQTTCFFLI